MLEHCVSSFGLITRLFLVFGCKITSARLRGNRMRFYRPANAAYKNKTAAAVLAAAV